MRIVFLGSPQPAVAPLQYLLEHSKELGCECVAVVSQPARPVGRKSVPVDPPVAAFAKAHGIKVLQPESARSPEFLKEFQDLKPDIAITAAYGQILTSTFLAIPKRATINIHPSLLPLYRGATPVQSALLDHQTQTGVTILFTVQALDAGNIIVQETAQIQESERADALLARLFALSGAMLAKAFELLRNPDFSGTPQEAAKITHCRKFSKENGLIDWSRSKREIFDQFRAFYPWPGVYTFFRGKRISLTNMRIQPANVSHKNHGFFSYNKQTQCLDVYVNDGIIQILNLKPEGAREIDAAAFWNGLRERDDLHFSASAGVQA